MKYYPEDPALLLDDYEEDIRYEMFLQYAFFQQWSALKEAANLAGIHVMGDIPFYVGIDSQDVWAGKANFLLDEAGQPTYIAGVPPDYFSKTGQRWGNPIYNWEHMEKTGFAFWLERLRYSSVLFDIIRIDHFRAFDTYWKIPASCPTAEIGEWVEAPGYAFFDRVREALPGATIVAEDLGDLRPEVHALRDHYGLMGMKIVQFCIQPGQPIAHTADEKENTVIYTGTHDNQTMQRLLPIAHVQGAHRALPRAAPRRILVWLPSPRALCATRWTTARGWPSSPRKTCWNTTIPPG